MMRRSSLSALGSLVAALILAAGLTGTVPLRAAAAETGCADHVLILAAMPLELNPLIAAAHIDEERVVQPAGQAPRTFYVGTLEDAAVVLAMTGVGMVNAEQTTKAAFGEFGACFRGVLFSGVAGSIHNIGDVAIAEDWRADGTPGTTLVDSKMLATARELEAANAVELAQSVPVGDAACLCPGVDAPTPVTMPQPAALHVGGHGTTSDLFGGHAVPCMPGGGDIAGCKPCILQQGFDRDAAAFARNVPTILTPSFFAGFFGAGGTTDSYVSQDMETALVAQVSAANDVPFLGVRAVSDGPGDPLHLPGFPAQFAVYRQLAGNNAAAVTIAFLRTWAGAGYPRD